MRKLFFYISLIMIIILPGCSQEVEDLEEVSVPVKVYEVKSETLTQYITLNGNITAGKDQVLFSKVSERINKLYVKAGDRVRENQKIAEQYNEILIQAYDAAKANTANAKAQLELAQQNYDRLERLYKQRAISTQQFEQTSTQLKAAMSAAEAAEAQLNQAREQLENSVIKAPFSGTVAAVFVEDNQMVPAGQQVAQVIDRTSMKSNVRVSGKDISYIKMGQEVIVTIPSIAGKSYKGKINSVDLAVDPVSKTLEVEVVIINSDEFIKSGMYGEFRIAINSVKNTIIIPENALISQTEVIINKETGKQESNKRYFLFIVKNEKAELKEVTTGLSSDGRVQITGGLNIGDKVVVVGNNVVREGQKVNIIV